MLKNEYERIDDLNIDDLKLLQDTRYFMFGMDSVLLANIVRSDNPSNVIVDLCTGSAVIPILLTSRASFAKIVGVELQQEMYDLAIRNIQLNELSDKISIAHSDICDYVSTMSNVYSFTKRSNVDIVICNPPYKQKGTGVGNSLDVKYIARHEEKCTLENVFECASKLLKSRGKLYLVHKPERLADLITVARSYKLEIKEITFMQPTIDKKPSIVLLEYVKDGGNESVVNPVIIEYDENGNYTSKIKEIYRIKEENTNG